MRRNTIARTCWDKSPFPDLYEKRPKTPLCAKLVHGKHISDLILVHHLHESSLPFIKALSNGYSIKRIIGIPYSSVNLIINKLKKDFELIIPNKLEDIADLIKETVKSTKKNIIIEEIGGYTRDIADYLDKTEHVKGIVEDTIQGLWRWQGIKLKRLPILSIVFSRLKRVEDKFVSQSIIDGMEYFLNCHNLPLIKNQKILLLGFGNVGEQIAKYLKPLCKELVIYDKDSTRLLKASVNYKISTDLLDTNIILGVTGDPKHSVKVKDIGKLGQETILISGSSKRLEFDLEGFRKKANKTVLSDDIWTYCFDKKIVHVASHGEPINLKYSVVPSKILDLVYGSLVYCINKIDRGVISSGLHEISEVDQREILRIYNQIYKTSRINL